MATKPNVPEPLRPELVTSEPRAPQELEDDSAELTPEQKKATHRFYASAYLLDADLREPLQKKIDHRGKIELRRNGRYEFAPSERFHFKGIISYRSGYTQVAGHTTKTRHGFVTLATSVVEDLNVLDVVTADRVVAQISTQHPLYPDGAVPAVTFLGTRFENLRIGGHRVKVEPHLHILGPWRKPEKSYFDDEKVTNRIGDQYAAFQRDFSKLQEENAGNPHPLSERDAKELSAWMTNKYPVNQKVVQDTSNGGKSMGCSLVNSIGFEEDTCYKPFGHVIHVPHFGKIILAELKVRLEKAKAAKRPAAKEHDKYHFSLTMIRLEMGCIANGSTGVSNADTNGGGSGGHH